MSESDVIAFANAWQMQLRRKRFCECMADAIAAQALLRMHGRCNRDAGAFANAWQMQLRCRRFCECMADAIATQALSLQLAVKISWGSFFRCGFCLNHYFPIGI